jgi:hypothetical protein
VAAADVDGDADLDLFVGAFNNFFGGAYCPQITDKLFLNDGRGGFDDATERAGLTSIGGTMGAAFFDFDNDGRPDLYVARGGPERDRVEIDLVYRNLGDGKFAEVGGDLGIVNRAAGHGVTAADADVDGDLDVLVPSGALLAGTEARCKLFENLGPVGGFVSFRPEGEKGNLDAVGAKVLLTMGTSTELGEVMAGSGFASQMPLEAWFGVGERREIDRATVIWRSGIVREGKDLPVGTRVRVLLPVDFVMLEPRVSPLDPSTNLGAVELHWEDPRSEGGRFRVSVRQEQEEGALVFREETALSRTTLNLAPGSYEVAVELMDDLGPVSSARPGAIPIRIDEPERSPAAAGWSAFPNPFHRSLTLTGAPFNEGKSLSIEILDVRGRSVESLVIPGTGAQTRAVWSGMSSTGGTAPPGEGTVP